MCEAIGSKVQLVICDLTITMYGSYDCGVCVDDALESFMNSVVGYRKP